MVTKVQATPAADPPAASPALEALASQADAMGAPPGDAGQVQAQQPEKPKPGNFEAIAFLLTTFREVGSQITQTTSLNRTLADPNIERTARVLVPVAEKYGLNLGAYMGGPEGTAIMVAGPILWTAATEFRAELAARRRKPEELEPPAPEAGQAPAPAP